MHQRALTGTGTPAIGHAKLTRLRLNTEEFQINLRLELFFMHVRPKPVRNLCNDDYWRGVTWGFNPKPIDSHMNISLHNMQ